MPYKGGRLSTAYKARPCQECGVTGKYYAKGKCNSCYTKARIAATPGLKEIYNRNKRERVLQECYGISCEDYDRMFAQQGGRCAICEETYADTANHGQYFSVDHCHKTGKVRALLCSNCNFGIGHFKDDETRLSSALMYLRRFSE